MDRQNFLNTEMVHSLPSVPCGLQCMSVHILSEQPVHVIPGSALVLKARIEHGPLEEVSTVTWEREPETGICVGTRPKVRVNVEQQETTLQINEYSRADGGVYTVTVTDHTGAKTPAQCIAVNHVSVSINVSHSSLVCGEAWGTDPRFYWLHERATITKTVGNVSPDGATLSVTMTPICGHFTCVVSNKLGYSSATYTAGRILTLLFVCASNIVLGNVWPVCSLQRFAKCICCIIYLS
uniref:Si:dkeyp-97a10.2 n=1 Tax=Seriola lalandi dorsalis TaxID=1841481 RepID=A0A3B4WDI3_SERLL